MRTLFSNLLLVISSSLLASTIWANNIITAGHVHTCYVNSDVSSPKCWGDNSYGQLDVNPSNIKHIISLDAGAWHTCALYLEGGHEETRKLACWGDDSFGQKTIPAEIINPIYLSVGDWHNCAIHTPPPGNPKVFCWGQEDFTKTSTPKDVIAPTAVFAGDEFSCAIHSTNRLRCWGGLNVDEPIINYPLVKTGRGFYCVKKGKNLVDCWSNLPGQDMGFVMQRTRYQTCVLENGELNCFDAKNKRLNFFQSTLYKPWDFAVGNNHVCAFDRGGVQCAALRDHIPQIEKLLTPIVNGFFNPQLERIGDAKFFLDMIAECVYEYDAQFILNVNDLLKHEATDKETLFLLNALQPYFSDSGYTHIVEYYLAPSMEKLLAFNRSVEPKLIGLDSFGYSKRNREIATHILSHSLRTAKRLINADDRGLVDELATAFASANGNAVSVETAEKTLQLSDKYLLSSYLRSRMLMNQALVFYLKPELLEKSISEKEELEKELD